MNAKSLCCFEVVFVCLFLLLFETRFHRPTFASKSRCRPGSPGTQRPPTSASHVLGMQMGTTMLDLEAKLLYYDSNWTWV